MSRFACGTTLIVASLFHAAASHASGPGFSGIFATADNAETVAANPAGMVMLEGTQITLQGALIQDFSSFKVNEDDTTVDGGNPQDATPVLAPSLYYSHQYNEDWFLGFSLNIPLGFGANHGRKWAGRYYSDEFSLVYVSLNPAVAYRVNDNLSLGARVRVMYTDSTVQTQVNNSFLGRDYDDGKLETSADGVGFGYSLHALYAFSEDTRVGLSYNSQISTDLDSTVDFSNVRRPAGVIDRLQSQTIEIGSKVPMFAGMGVYHRMDNDWELTLDVLWMQFSKFGATSIELSEATLDVPDDQFNDFFVSSVGLTWPLNSRMSAAVGAFWMESPVDNDKRGFGISLDQMMGVGAGYTYKLDNGDDYELEVNLIDTGSAPIDTGPSLVKGRVVGKSKDHYSLAISLAYNWR
tara:strand:+ start:1131 stop:2354 length:1224 start_codon:yes stop_codon:yes gene_type:complete